MERIPNFNISGELVAKKKEQFLNILESNSREQRLKFLNPNLKKIIEKTEISKTESDLNIINYANKKSSELIEKLGLEPSDTHADAVHIVPIETMKKISSNSHAVSNTVNKAIFIDENWRTKKILFARSIFHENLHHKSPVGIHADEKGWNLTRSGISVIRHKGTDTDTKTARMFDGLHEAIVSSQERDFIKDLVESDQIKDESDWLKSTDVKKLKSELAFAHKIPSEEIAWIENINGRWNFYRIPYPEQRKVLSYIVSKIFHKFSEIFSDEEEVMKIFLTAHFSGRLLPIARLIEKTFGEGSFKMIGEMDTSDKSAETCFLNLSNIDVDK